MGDFKLTIDPTEKVLFAGKFTTEAATFSVKLTNPLKERIAYKIKCTSNELFRIRPPVDELKPGETTTVALIFNSGKQVPENGKHYFAFYYVKAGEDEKKPARAVWTEHKGEPEGCKKLFVDFKKEGGDDKKEEKKEDKKKDEKKEDKKKDEKKDGEDKKEDDDGDKK